MLEVLSPDAAERAELRAERADVARNAARHDLSRLLSGDDEQDTRAEYLLRASGMSGPGDAIIACARELDVELIVMGKHRLGFVEHLLAGSVAEKVMRHAPCPVLDRAASRARLRGGRVAARKRGALSRLGQ